MIGITVKNLMDDQNKRLKKMRQQEKEENASDTAKYLFKQKPYYLIANRRDEDE